MTSWLNQAVADWGADAKPCAWIDRPDHHKADILDEIIDSTGLAFNARAVDNARRGLRPDF